MRQNETFFPRGIFKSDIIFIGRKVLKYFNDFYNWHLFNLIGKVSTIKEKEITSHRRCANMTVFFFIYKVVHCLNDF